MKKNDEDAAADEKSLRASAREDICGMFFALAVIDQPWRARRVLGRIDHRSRWRQAMASRCATIAQMIRVVQSAVRNFRMRKKYDAAWFFFSKKSDRPVVKIDVPPVKTWSDLAAPIRVVILFGDEVNVAALRAQRPCLS